MDLNIYSIISGGELTPSEIVCEAVRKKISVISITDYDEISGYYSAKAGFLGVRIIPGIELRTNESAGELKFIGYNIDLNSPILLDYIIWRKKERIEWAAKVVKILKHLGFQIDFSSCLNQISGTGITRKHIAKELYQKNFFNSPLHAYETLLKEGAPAFVRRPLFTAEDAIQLIRQAGGESYLAHPGKYNFSVPINRLRFAGLNGIQAYHPSHTKEETEYWEGAALSLGLKLTGGSGYFNSVSSAPIGDVWIGDECIKQWQTREVVL